MTSTRTVGKMRSTRNEASSLAPGSPLNVLPICKMFDCPCRAATILEGFLLRLIALEFMEFRIKPERSTENPFPDDSWPRVLVQYVHSSGNKTITSFGVKQLQYFWLHKNRKLVREPHKKEVNPKVYYTHLSSYAKNENANAKHKKEIMFMK